MGLLAADLRALANLPATRLGRRLMTSTGIGLVLVAMLSWWFARAIVDRPLLLAQLYRDSQGDSLRGLLGYGLLAGPIVASWLGLALGQRQLFEAPELALWRQAPIAGWRAPVQVLLRATFLSTCWASALSLPFVVAVLQRSPAPAWAFALAPLAILGATAPLLATLLATHIVLVRFFAGRWLRLVFAILGALASVGFSTWLLLTMVARGHDRAPEIAGITTQSGRLPWTIDTGAALLAAAARGELDLHALLGITGWLFLAFAAFRAVSHLHPGACERHLAAEPPLWKNGGRRWPASIAATVRRKEYAQLLQQPGALIGFLVFAVLVFALVQRQVLVTGILANPRLPRDVLHVAALLTQWFLAVLLVLYAHMGRLVLWDAPQWSLWVASPAAPFAILRGKLVAIFVFLLWPLLLVGLAGALTLDAGPAALLAFTGIALGGTLTALGVLAAVGTWPRLMQPDDGGQAAQSGRSFLGALLLVVGFELAAAPAVFGWLWLQELAQHRPLSADVVWQWAPQVVAAAGGYGLLIAALGILVGTANYRRLLRPR